MSSAVQVTFLEALTRSKRLALAALRCADRYVLELRMDGSGYRPLGELSGGQRVSVLLSLLLETADNRPPGDRPARGRTRQPFPVRHCSAGAQEAAGAAAGDRRHPQPQYRRQRRPPTW